MSNSSEGDSATALLFGLRILLCVGVATYAIHHIWKKRIEYQADTAFGAQHGCQPPPQLPNRWPLGIDRLIELWKANSEKRLLKYVDGHAAEYEPRNNLSQVIMFAPRMYHVLHPKNVEAVLSTNFKDYCFGVRQSVFAPLLGNGIFTQEGPAWKHSRELLRKQFMKTQYQNLDRFKAQVDDFMSHLPSTEGVVDLQPLFFSLTLDTTTELLLGRSVRSLRANSNAQSENRVFAESFDIAQEGLAKRFRIAPLHFLYNPPGFRNACANVHRFVEKYIEERKLAENDPDSTDKSFEFVDQVAAESAGVQDLRDQLLNVLLAGRDTTACCLSWAFRLLVRHPTVMARLRAEIKSVMGDSEYPTKEQIRKMPFLSTVIKETLRLYPSVPLNNRTAVRTTILPTGGGPDGNSPMLVRRGELVTFSPFVNSRRKNIYGSNAEDFRPERWETGELADIGWGYFPFNGGPRICLGQDFALMSISYTIVRLLQAYPIIALPDGEKNEPIGTETHHFTLVLSCGDGCKVKFSKDSSLMPSTE